MSSPRPILPSSYPHRCYLLRATSLYSQPHPQTTSCLHLSTSEPVSIKRQYKGSLQQKQNYRQCLKGEEGKAGVRLWFISVYYDSTSPQVNKARALSDPPFLSCQFTLTIFLFLYHISPRGQSDNWVKGIVKNGINPHWVEAQKGENQSCWRDKSRFPRVLKLELVCHVKVFDSQISKIILLGNVGFSNFCFSLLWWLHTSVFHTHIHAYSSRLMTIHSAQHDWWFCSRPYKVIMHWVLL